MEQCHQGFAGLDIWTTEFEHNGFVVIPDLLGADHLACMRGEAVRCLSGEARPDLDAAVPELHRMLDPELADRSNDPAAAVPVMMHLCHTRAAFLAHALHPAIVSVARALLRAPPRLFTDLLFNKPPRVGKALEFHQDHAYYRYIKPFRLVTCWYALDDATEENGCLRFVPGTHHRLLEHERSDGRQALLLDERLFRADDVISVPVRAGTAIFHHSLAVHASGPNKSDAPRRGLATLYFPDDSTVDPDFSFPYPLRRI